MRPAMIWPLLLILLASTVARSDRDRREPQAFTGAYDVLDSRWGENTGAGGDDSAAINAALAAAAKTKGGGGLVIFPPPPSGAYNICAAPITRPDSAYNSLTLMGAASGGVSIRILPGCASGIQTVVLDPPIRFAFPATASAVRMALENLRLDASCIAPHVLVSGFDPGFNAHNVVFRNARGGYDSNGAPSSDVYIAGAYEGSIDNTNRIENVNDRGRECYAGPSDFPGFGIYTSADDWQFGAPSVGAEIANYAAVNGGGNMFLGAHGWGYSAGNADRQVVSQPLYTFLNRGYNSFVAVFADSPVLSGIRTQVIPGRDNVDRITGIVSGGSGGAPDAFVRLTGTSGVGAKFQAVGFTNHLGRLAGVVWVTIPGNYASPPIDPANEPMTSDGGLRGVVLSLAMGANGMDSEAASINGLTMEGATSGAHGVEVGVAEQKLQLTNGRFGSLGSAAACLVADAGAVSADALVADNLNCEFSQYPTPINLQNGVPIEAANAGHAFGPIIVSNSRNDLYFGDIAGAFGGAVRWRSSGTDAFTLSAAGHPAFPRLPAPAGGGGAYVCADEAGNLYRKSSCP